MRPPQDCRSRGDCGLSQTTAAGARSARLKIAAVAATAAAEQRLGLEQVVPPQDCRSRGDCGLKIRKDDEHKFPPQDCRSRGDCGWIALILHHARHPRLKIAAVAATAA